MRQHLIAAALALGCHGASALDIKGIEVDKPADCDHIAGISGYDATASCRSSRPDFLVATTFLGTDQTLFVVRNEDHAVSAVYLQGFDFNQAEVAFTAKFGRPKVHDTVIQNALGATFSQRRLVWETATTVLKVARHGERIGTATAILDSKRELARFSKQHSKARGDI